MSKYCTEEQKIKIISYWEKGLKVSQIAKELKRSRPTIDRWLERWSRERTTECRKKSGRPLITTPEEEVDISLMCAENPFDDSTDIKQKLNLSCSAKTVDRFIKSLGIDRATAVRKCLLKANHKKIRFNFCEMYKHWGVKQWSGVTFSGKSNIMAERRYAIKSILNQANQDISSQP